MERLAGLNELDTPHTGFRIGCDARHVSPRWKPWRDGSGNLSHAGQRAVGVRDFHLGREFEFLRQSLESPLIADRVVSGEHH